MIVFLCFAGSVARALGPHEILLLVNPNSAESVAVGHAYAGLRQVPESNVVSIPAPDGSTVVDMETNEFVPRILLPAQTMAVERGIADHILAWVLAPGFPTRVKTSPPMSITGAVFVRGRWPDPADVEKGACVSPLFAGPVRPLTRQFGPQTLDVQAEWLRGEMPIPCMMLGVTGQAGNTVAEILRCLRTGAESDGTRPEARAVFQRRDDIRSRCREWQFAPAAEEVNSMNTGLRAVVTNSFPAGATGILGFMTGAAVIAPEERLAFVPGAMAEHLTSLAGDFSNGSQTKLSAWIKAGATASAGTVAEPYSLWQKFPSARFFAHYAAGCTMIEAFYQSIRCPLQILPVGDPLSCPYRTEATLKITMDGDGAATAAVAADPIEFYSRFLWLLDGRTIGGSRSVKLDTEAMSGGSHVLRCVAYRSGAVRQQVFAERRIAGKEPAGRKDGR